MSSSFTKLLIRTEVEMIPMLAMLNTYLERFINAICKPFCLVVQAFTAQAAIKFIATYAWQFLTPLPAPVLRLRS
jgi:hypothetical protein